MGSPSCVIVGFCGIRNECFILFFWWFVVIVFIAILRILIVANFRGFLIVLSVLILNQRGREMLLMNIIGVKIGGKFFIKYSGRSVLFFVAWLARYVVVWVCRVFECGKFLFTHTCVSFCVAKFVKKLIYIIASYFRLFNNNMSAS